MYKNFKFGCRHHRGGLKESLETSVYISFDDFREMSKNYSFYAIDERCNQILFIRNEMDKYYTEPTWLFIEYELCS